MSTETTALKFVKLEHNIFLDGEKVASFQEDGTLRMAKGQSAVKPELMLWLANQNDLPQPAPAAEQVEEEEQPEDETPTPAPAEKPKKSAIPPCPEMTIEAGDKTPEVIAWFKKYKPEEFEKRYKGRRFKLEA